MVSFKSIVVYPEPELSSPLSHQISNSLSGAPVARGPYCQVLVASSRLNPLNHFQIVGPHKGTLNEHPCPEAVLIQSPC